MPLFARTDPGLRPLIAYLVARSRERSITLNRTKLVKLLYLIDVERARSRRDPLTGLQWVFFHYGPYAFELIDELEAMEGGSQLVAQKWKDSVMYRAAPDAPDGDDWPAPTKAIVDKVITRFAPMDLHELLDHVYFHTGPMIAATRGEPLDLRRARDDAPDRPRRPIAPPPAPADVKERLARWRKQHTERLVPVQLDPPGVFLAAPDEDLAGEGIVGRLHIPADTDPL